MSLLPDQEPGRHDNRLARIEAAVNRMEASLNRLLQAMAEDEQDDERGVDLAGDPLPADRDPYEPL